MENQPGRESGTLLGVSLIIAGIAFGSYAYYSGVWDISGKSQTAAVINAEQQSAATTTDPVRYVPGQILVKFKAGVSKALHDKDLKENKGSFKKAIPHIGAEIITVPVGAEKKVRDALAKNPHVAYAELDGLVDSTLMPNDPYFSQSWGLTNVNAPSAWDFTHGNPAVTVAVLDSGIDSVHPDLVGNLVPGYNFMSNSTNTDYDGACGHGTAVAGVIAATGNNALGTIGVAWTSKIAPYVIADASLSCAASWSAIANAYTYAADHGVRIINISYAGQTGSLAEQNAAAYAWGKGSIIFAASGNAGNNVPQYPAADPYTVAVGGTDGYGGRASFSTYGNWIDVAAPGTAYTTDVFGTRGYTTADYINISGTSLAAPMVSGIAALILSVNPGLTAGQVVDILEKNADDKGDPGYDIYTGWGQVNAARAVTAANTTSPYIDTVPPVVGPATYNTFVGGQITLTPKITDNIGVAKVELYKNGVLYATDTTGPYYIFWDTTAEANGSSVTLMVKAYDFAGNVGNSSVTVTVDNIPPSLSIATPLPGSVLSGVTTLSATKSDNNGQVYVNWFVDGINAGDYSQTGTYSWNSASVPDGAHTIVAQGFDLASNKTYATTTVTTKNGTQDTTLPTTVINNPGDGTTVSGTVYVSVLTSDNASVSKTELYKDGALLGSVAANVFNYAWDTTQETNGTHTLQSKAYDPSGNVGVSTITTVTVQNGDTQNPTTSITSPVMGSTVGSTVTVSATASDNVGVTRVELWEDGVFKASDTTSPYAWSWDTLGDTNGNHTLVTKAYDAAGNGGNSSGVSVTVANVTQNAPDTTAPVVTITAPKDGTRLKNSPTTSISVSASDVSGIASIVISVDGISAKTCSLATSCSYTWSTKSVAAGAHTIKATATDNSVNKNVSTKSITVTK